MFEVQTEEVGMHLYSCLKVRVSRQVEHLKMIKTDAVIGQSPRAAHRTGYGRI